MSGWAVALRLAGLGWYVAFCIVLGVGGGVWLDKKAGTTPLFILLGTVLGVVVAFYGIYKLVASLMADSDRSGNNAGKGAG
ncbi:MAG: AtpZ/AtpI family protein [SAR202 cluster bacterium]|nr:AtpZ/AtpI family protein [SAR202 cluster bacterium]